MLGQCLFITPCEVVYSPLLLIYLWSCLLSITSDKCRVVCSLLLVQYQMKSCILIQNTILYTYLYMLYYQIQVHWIRSPPFYWTQFNKAVNVFFISFTDAFSDSKPVEEIYKSAWIAFRQIRPNLVLKQFNNIM